MNINHIKKLYSIQVKFHNLYANQILFNFTEGVEQVRVTE
jgi:hypothetical protein